MSKSRREFIHLMGWATAAAALGPARAGAERIRVLPDAPGPEATMVTGQVSPDFQRFIAGISVGPAASHGGVSVLWLYGRDVAPPLDVATLEEARARGALLITERAQASVPELVVENRGKSHVLLLAGEILIGGKQNRVLREDILLPPLSGPRHIGVYCVEQGRWNEGRADFESKGTLAQPGLRARLMERADQARVWAEVGKSARAAEAPSATGSYQQIYEKPEVKDRLEAVERGIDSRAVAGALGAAVFLGPALAGLDLFHAPGLFGREWPKLLRAYAVDLYRTPAGSVWEERRARARVESVLLAASKVEGALRGNAGVGHIFEFRVDRSRGAALMFEGHAVHTAIL